MSAYWLAYPAPQTLTIDLGRVQRVGRVEVVAFWVTQSQARYRIEASADRERWTTLVSESEALGPATKDGYVHRFPPVEARYLRLVTARGAQFPSTMIRINEIRAYEGL